MSPETSQQAGWLLHYMAYRDTSFILDAFTLEHGRLPLMARGARTSKPRVRALYQPFQPLLLSWVGRGDMRTLIGIEPSAAAIDFNNRALACAYYLNELLLRLLGRNQVQPDLFAHYSLALSQLATEQAVEATLRTFEVQLLDVLGLLPDLLHCTPSGKEVESSSEYHFYPASAIAVPIGACQPGIGEPTSTLDPAWHPDGVTADDGVRIRGATLQAIATLDFSNDDGLEEVKKVMRRLLRIHLGGKPLNSRNLFDTLVQPAS